MNTNTCEHKNVRAIGDTVHCRDCEPIQYISTTDTAKLIRAALKAAFPDTKFRVRSHIYAGGSSINVSYVDGPPTKAVEGVAKRFAGASFDGMQDLMEYHNSIFDGRPVQFGANFVFVHREYSGDETLNADDTFTKTRRIDQVERILAARWNPNTGATWSDKREYENAGWRILSNWDARWETLERAVNKYLTHGYYNY